MDEEKIRQQVRNFIYTELFDGEIPQDFTDDTPLISSRLMDSIVTLYMVNHFEEQFNIVFEAHEVSVDNLDTVNIFVKFIAAKLSS